MKKYLRIDTLHCIKSSKQWEALKNQKQEGPDEVRKEFWWRSTNKNTINFFLNDLRLRGYSTLMLNINKEKRNMIMQ